MPLAHIRCCDTTFTIEEAYEHVRDRNNGCEWTYELLDAMFKTSVAHPSNEDPTRISTTVLTGKCKRQTALERFNPFTKTPGDLWAAFRGTMFHAQLEKYVAPGSYGEARFFVEDLGQQIPELRKHLKKKGDRSFSGSPDLVDPMVGVLYDYKRTKEVPRFNTTWPDHTAQLNINRWLVDYADYVEHEGERYDLQDADVRARFVPVEWQELVVVYVDDKGPKPIAVTKSIQIPKKDGNGTKAARVADIWSDKDCEDYIVREYVESRLALNTGIAPIPEGWEHQSHVLCGYCPVRDLCAAAERDGK